MFFRAEFVINFLLENNDAVTFAYGEPHSVTVTLERAASEYRVGRWELGKVTALALTEADPLLAAGQFAQRTARFGDDGFG